MVNNSPRLFWPQNLGPYEVDLRSLIIDFQQVSNRDQQIHLIETALQSLSFYPNGQETKLRYRAFLHVLADLLRQEWSPEFRQGQLYLLPPNWTSKTKNETEALERKLSLRRSLTWERTAQFEKSSVQEFIYYMEQERPFGENLVSIRSLFADGQALAQTLREILEIKDKTKQQRQISTIIHPYLQLITTGARCQFTGFYLQDIWRYFRYTWSTPYNSTPGRQMFYLVRDPARPFHPIIGIAALGSSMVQLTVRDDVIGWTPKAIQEKINSSDYDDDQARSFVQMLRQTLRDVINDLAVDDLITHDELNNPTPQTFQKLADIERRSKEHRRSLFKEKHEREQDQVTEGQLSFNSIVVNIDSNNNTHNLIDQAQEELYRSKRAGVLRQILQAQQSIIMSSMSIEGIDGLRAFWKTADGEKTIKTLVRENKKRRIGINMMDIIVCGSIPPYNTLLGGKLVAMLLASPQIVHDYQEKYTDYASTIASQMKGKEVKRNSKLVFLGTTSLYANSSSQYNRIAIPIKDSGEGIRYIHYGLTEGYGSVHFSGETVDALTDLQELIQGARLINNRFGEGVNPKLRRVRTGLAAIGLPSVDNFMRHRSQRIVYGIPLGRRCYKFLCGETEDPGYYLNATSDSERQQATNYICDYWATRWLLSRIHSTRFLDEVSKFLPESALLSREVNSSQEYSS